MKVYKSTEIRNIAVASHQGSGKTSLIEAIMFATGAINRMGKVTDGNTVSDFRPEEIKKKISVNTALIAAEWQNQKINFLDVPGFTDFQGELEAAIPVVENVLMVIDAASGVGVSTEQISDMAKEMGKSQIYFINKMDRENADFEKVIEGMKDIVAGTIVPVQLPIGAEASFNGIVDLIEKKAYTYDDKGIAKQIDIPADLVDEVEAYHMDLMEAAAEGDDDLMMKYLDGEEMSDDEIRAGLKGAIISGSVAPVLCGSATKGIGADLLLTFIEKYFPSPADILPADDAGKPFAGLVFKTVTDAFLGRLSYTKIYQGALKADIGLYNQTLEKDEKISGLCTFQGKPQVPLAEFNFGDIAVIAKLPTAKTNNILVAKGTEAEIAPIQFSTPTHTVAIEPISKNDEDKLGAALQKILEEDLTLTCVKDKETKQTLLTGMGETHIDMALERLQRQYSVGVQVVERRLPYRETIRGTAQKVEGKHKKQSGGHGQFGHVYIDIEPCYDEEFVFEEKIFGGSVPKQYIPAVEKGLRESLSEGVLAGYPVSNIKVTLVDGSYHPVDSSEMAFKVATNLAFKKACELAKPILMEPIVDVEIRIPDQYTGDIMSDMSGRRGRVNGTEKDGKFTVIKASAPLAEMSRYTIDLKSMTQGRGKFSMKFAQYSEAPQPIAEKVIAAHKSE